MCLFVCCCCGVVFWVCFEALADELNGRIFLKWWCVWTIDVEVEVWFFAMRILSKRTFVLSFRGCIGIEDMLHAFLGQDRKIHSTRRKHWAGRRMTYRVIATRKSKPWDIECQRVSVKSDGRDVIRQIKKFTQIRPFMLQWDYTSFIQFVSATGAVATSSLVT